MYKFLIDLVVANAILVFGITIASQIIGKIFIRKLTEN